MIQFNRVTQLSQVTMVGAALVAALLFDVRCSMFEVEEKRS